MAIIFHCEHCSKKIEAQDSAGGKWGNCPACHNKVYIPALDANEELKLAPIDENDLKRQKQLMEETYKLRQDILLEREIPSDSGDDTVESSVTDKEITASLITYLTKAVDGRVNEAENSLKDIKSQRLRATRLLDQIALGQIHHPRLEGIPQPVLSGFIRELRAKIS